MARTLAWAILSLSVAASASAQIYQWTDGSGSRHFTNDVEDIPLDQRNMARVIVRQRRPALAHTQDATHSEDAAQPREVAQVADLPVAEDSEPSVAVAAGPEARESLSAEVHYRPRRQAQVVYDRSRERVVSRSDPADRPSVVQDVYVNIDGPLSVSQVVVAPPQYGDFDDRYHDPYLYGPAVSTAFDRGRFRHRTLRMVLQDQFQYDRNDSFFYLESRTPRGPVFQPHLSRGLLPERTRSVANPTMARLHRIASPKKR